MGSKMKLKKFTKLGLVVYIILVLFPEQNSIAAGLRIVHQPAGNNPVIIEDPKIHPGWTIEHFQNGSLKSYNRDSSQVSMQYPDGTHIIKSWHLQPTGSTTLYHRWNSSHQDSTVLKISAQSVQDLKTRGSRTFIQTNRDGTEFHAQEFYNFSTRQWFYAGTIHSDGQPIKNSHFEGFKIGEPDLEIIQLRPVTSPALGVGP
jgi:hypothetical protein